MLKTIKEKLISIFYKKPPQPVSIEYKNLEPTYTCSICNTTNIKVIKEEYAPIVEEQLQTVMGTLVGR